MLIYFREPAILVLTEPDFTIRIVQFEIQNTAYETPSDELFAACSFPASSLLTQTEHGQCPACQPT
jgi:hypothetical protein